MITQNLDELKPRRLWVNFVLTPKATGGYSKPPINPATLCNARNNAREDWTDYDTAAANAGKTATYTKDGTRSRYAVQGVGVVLADGLYGIDIDHAIDDDGNVNPVAARIVAAFDSYTEVSPSGHGLHIYLVCDDLLNEGASYNKIFHLTETGQPTTERAQAFAVEFHGTPKGRTYFTVTGRPFAGYDKPINHTNSAKLKEVYDYFLKNDDAYREAQRPAASHYDSPGRAAAAEDDRIMVESALKCIDPYQLRDWNEWAGVMSALKEMGYSYDFAEHFSSGALCGSPNPKNDPKRNAYSWRRQFRLKDGITNAPGVIFNVAKRFGWKPADAFSDERRAAYGRSLYSDAARLAWARAKYSDEERAAYGRSLHPDPEERREYGRQLHADDWTDEDEAKLKEFIERRRRK